MNFRSVIIAIWTGLLVWNVISTYQNFARHLPTTGIFLAIVSIFSGYMLVRNIRLRQEEQ